MPRNIDYNGLAVWQSSCLLGKTASEGLSLLQLKNRTPKLAGLCAAALLGAGMANAASVDTFNYNTLSSGANSTSISNYMNGILGCSCVTVTGAVADKTYNGEGFVTGPGSSHASKSLTLGNSDGATASNSN